MDIKITLENKQLYPAVVNLKQFSNNTDVLTFEMENYMYETTDLSKLDAYAVCDMVNQEIDEIKLEKQVVEGKLRLKWTVTGYTTQLDGHIAYQIVFKNIENDKSVMWFSHQGIIFISESHDGDGQIVAKYPTILQQWEERMKNTDTNASSVLKQAQTSANTATQKANEAAASATKAENEANEAEASATKAEQMKDYINELMNYEGTNAIEKEVVAARGEYPSLGNRIDNNENRLDTIEEQGVSVADTLPIGAQVMWDDKNPLPDNWEYVDDDISDNRQLLINNEFSVNTRGKSEYTENGYTLPMWNLLLYKGSSTGSSGSVSVLSGGGVKITNGDYQTVLLNQKLDDSLRGRTFTFVGKFENVKSGVGSEITFKVSESTTIGGDSRGYGAVSITEDGVYAFTLELPQKTTYDYMKIQVNLKAGSSCDVKYIDMFPGGVAYQHQREHYATVLDRCYDYIQSLSNGELRVLMVASTQDGVAAGFGFYKKMISKPIVVALEVKNSKGERLSKAVALCDEYGVMRISANGSPEWISNTYMYLEDLIVSCEPL